jgi:hypothetical protein
MQQLLLLQRQAGKIFCSFILFYFNIAFCSGMLICYRKTTQFSAGANHFFKTIFFWVVVCWTVLRARRRTKSTPEK